MGKVPPNVQLSHKLPASISTGAHPWHDEQFQLLYLLRMERNNAWNHDYGTGFSKFTA